MPKYWVKNYFSHGRFPEVGEKQKAKKKKKKKSTHGPKVHAEGSPRNALLDTKYQLSSNNENVNKALQALLTDTP